MRTIALIYTLKTELYLKRRRRARYLSKAITVKVQRDTVPGREVIKLRDKHTAQRSLGLSHEMAKKYTENKG